MASRTGRARRTTAKKKLSKAAAPATAGAEGEALTEVVAGAVAAHVKDQDLLAWIWPKIEREILAANAHDDAILFPGIAANALQAAIGDANRRTRVRGLHNAFQRVWTGLQPKGKASAKAGLFGLFGPNLHSEWNSLSAFVRANVDGGFGAWANLRSLMFTRFGASSNPTKAIQRINAYYAKLLSGGLGSRTTPVHPDLKARLDRASALLTLKGVDSVLSTLISVGGFNIRKNANNNSSLSNHSFGWAVDLDPKLNPNTRKENLPVDLIKALTGVDIYGDESERLRTTLRPYDAAFTDTKVLSDSNHRFVAGFRDLSSLKAAWVAAIARLYAATFDQAAIDTAFDLAGAKPPKEAELRAHVGTAGVPAAKQRECARFLIDSVALFRLAQKPGLKPEVTGTKATVTRFGFYNLPPELVAALVASEGGGLNWLGAARNTKDYMHFDLRSENQPALF